MSDLSFVSRYVFWIASAMFQRVRVFGVFVKEFVRYALMVREVLLCLIGLILIGGIIFSFIEDLDLGASIYFAFITGLTIGYGDITPNTPIGRVVAVLIGVIGMIFIGLVVGIATRALSDLHDINLNRFEPAQRKMPIADKD